MPVVSLTHKGYIITQDPKFPAQKKIKFEGKGSVPAVLDGQYTNFAIAKEAIDLYLLSVQQAEEEAAAKKELAAARQKAKRKRLLMEEPDAPEEHTTGGDESVHPGPGDGGVEA